MENLQRDRTRMPTITKLEKAMKPKMTMIDQYSTTSLPAGAAELTHSLYMLALRGM